MCGFRLTDKPGFLVNPYHDHQQQRQHHHCDDDDDDDGDDDDHDHDHDHDDDDGGDHHRHHQRSGAPMELNIMRLSGDETLLTVPQVPGVPMGAPGMKLKHVETWVCHGENPRMAISYS